MELAHRMTGALTAGGRALAFLREGTAPALLAVGILGVALALRLYGLDWDKGFSYTPHPDERAILSYVDKIHPPGLGNLGSLLNAGESPWNPGWFPYGSFPLYLLKGVQLISAALPGPELHDLRLAGRTLSALADAATVMAVLLLGAKVYGRRVGLLAAAFASVAVIHIQLGHFYTVDTFLALFTVVSLYFMYRVATEGRARDSILAGAFIGLGLATKASQAPIYIAFVAAHLVYLFALLGSRPPSGAGLANRWPLALKGLLAGVATSALVMFIAEPYAFLDRSRFFADFTEQSEMVRRIRDYPYTRQYINTAPYWYHIRQLATWGLGWPLGLVAWAGMLFASLRGMRLDRGLAYLAVGWGLPAALLLYSSDLKLMVLATGIAAAALMATIPFRSRESRAGVLLLMWVVPYFLITGSFQVKFLRYLLPITPVLLLFGAQMLVALWEKAGRSLPAARPWLAAGLVVLMGVTAAYALAYISIYREPHTAVRASKWINRNAPSGAVVLKEHWEEGLPGLDGYVVRELPMYEPDGPAKVQALAQALAGADYLTLFSNRMYGTLPRIPERYPVSREYYRLLFTGELGYELVDVETAYPNLRGVALVDDTYRRPGVPAPPRPAAYSAPRHTLGLGFADESFTVYDHPKVLVFKNQARHDAAAIRRAIEGSAAYPSGLAGTVEPPTIGLMLSAEEAATQQRGGTWSDIVRTGSWTARLPLLAWLLLVEGIALLAFPVAYVLLRPLPDRGYLFSKALGLLLVCLVVWLLASLRWMAFSPASISVSLLLLGGVSAGLVWAKGREMAAFVRRQWPALAVGELVFLAAFLAFVLVRMANPDLWHPYRGGEKPMDFAYLNAVLRSTHMPPYDPWFAGGYLNYYYWGQFIVATLIKATGIDPGVAYNLAVPLFFALTVSGAFALVYAMAEVTRRRLSPGTAAGAVGLNWSAVLAGVGAGLFVAILGNLDGAIQVGQGAWRALVGHLPFGHFDFWRSSRMMAPDPPGFEITEFPFFTFLFSDLHAHLVAVPFALLALGLGLALLLGVRGEGDSPGPQRASAAWSPLEVARLAVLGVAVGTLRLINTWDYPTAATIAVAVVFLAGYFRHGGLALSALLDSALKAAFLLTVGFVVFLPFHLTNQTFFGSIEATTNKTVLWQFLAIHGLFILVIGSFFLREVWVSLPPAWHGAYRRLAFGAGRAPAGGTGGALRAESSRLQAARPLLLMLGVLLLLYLVSVAVSGPLGSTVPFLAMLAALVAVVSMRWLVSWKPDAPLVAFAALVTGVSLALAIGLDFYRVEGDIDRMNSVFKFYLQVWVLLGVVSAYLLWRLCHGRRLSWRALSPPARVWAVVLALMVLSASVYPFLGTRERLKDRFNARDVPLTLDGTAYVKGAVYYDQRGPIDLEADFEGIAWLRENVEGSPVVLEGVTPTYRWGGRVSIYTGLPTVVGWQWHQEQQRWGYRWAISQRLEDVNRIYSTRDASEALSLLERYGVKYVYVGQVERLYYPPEGLEKFDGALRQRFEKAQVNSQVAIYRLRGTQAASVIDTPTHSP